MACTCLYYQIWGDKDRIIPWTYQLDQPKWALSSTRDSLRHKCVRAKAAAQMVVCLPSTHETLGLNSSITCIVITAAWEKYRSADPGSMVILSYIATSLKERKSSGEESRKAPIVDFWLPAHTSAHT